MYLIDYVAELRFVNRLIFAIKRIYTHTFTYSNYITNFNFFKLKFKSRKDSTKKNPYNRVIYYPFYYKSFICIINLGQGQILGQCHVQGHGRGQGKCLFVCGFARWSMSVCAWLHLVLPDVSVDSAAGATT